MDGELTVTHELRRDISRVIRQVRPQRVLTPVARALLGPARPPRTPTTWPPARPRCDASTPTRATRSRTRPARRRGARAVDRPRALGDGLAARRPLRRHHRPRSTRKIAALHAHVSQTAHHGGHRRLRPRLARGDGPRRAACPRAGSPSASRSSPSATAPRGCRACRRVVETSTYRQHVRSMPTSRVRATSRRRRCRCSACRADRSRARGRRRPSPSRLSRMITKIAMSTSELERDLRVVDLGELSGLSLNSAWRTPTRPMPVTSIVQRAVEHARRDAQRRLADLGEEAAEQDGDARRSAGTAAGRAGTPWINLSHRRSSIPGRRRSGGRRHRRDDLARSLRPSPVARGRSAGSRVGPARRPSGSPWSGSAFTTLPFCVDQALLLRLAVRGTSCPPAGETVLPLTYGFSTRVEVDRDAVGVVGPVRRARDVAAVERRRVVRLHRLAVAALVDVDGHHLADRDSARL